MTSLPNKPNVPPSLDVIVLHREPILDRVPNLKQLIDWLAQRGHRVHVLTTHSRTFPTACFESANVTVHAFPERSRRWEVPTLPKFLLQSLRLVRNIKSGGMASVFIAGGRGALTIAPVVSALGGGRYIAHVVEYPSVCEPPPYQTTLSDRMEARGIGNAEAMIVHDDLHATVIARSMVDAPEHLTLPNASPGSFDGEPGHDLHRRLQLQSSTRILLHSGGFGSWFSSAEVAAVSGRLPAGYRLVFHVSHDISRDDYYVRYLQDRGDTDNTLFSLSPVNAAELNHLVGSARVGLAWYNPQQLTFRARMMGLAAGKIGQYLKCGVPVIASRLDSLKYLEEHQAGVLVDDVSEIPDALVRIEDDYARFRDNAQRCYRDLWEPAAHLVRIEKALIKIATALR